MDSAKQKPTIVRKVQERARLKLERGARHGLRWAFGFDRWHVSTLAERLYAQDIIRYLNQRDPEHRGALVEIGCGVGDILRHARYRERLGLDIDLGALSCARFLAAVFRQGPMRFAAFRFPDDQLEGQFDVIVLVNWIHHIAPEVLRGQVASYLKERLLTGGEIIIDTVQDPAYKFNHSIDLLTEGLDAEMRHLGGYARQRDVYAVRRRKQ